MASLPSSFGRCRVVALLASGPLTTSYAAVQEPAGLEVVVKVRKPTLGPDSPLAARLVREAHVLARLHHPAIVQLHDFVHGDEGTWLVLERVDGPTLPEVQAALARLSTDAALAVAVDVAAALAHAHDRGVVHGELGPACVRFSRGGDVKLGELGAAAEAHEPQAPDAVEPGGALGSPERLAPEQIVGDPVDARTDVFALGVLLYEMLAGAHPFAAGEESSVAQRIRHEPPWPLRERAADVPRSVERVVLRCLEKHPGDRFASADEAGAALQVELRARTGASRASLVLTELQRARLVESKPARGAGRVLVAGESRAPFWLEPLTGFAVLAASLALVVGALQLFGRGDERDELAAGRALELVPARAGALRVVAHPWAEVIVDGQRVDVTPFARAIPVAAGTHHVTLRHPQAPDERRVVRVGAGETVSLDVSLAVPAPPVADAGVAPTTSATP